ncbi:MAG: hypothetical protein KGO53_06195 [Alphaproteobacteria bacterium]|nr:hypothetical protein [Alphaproteobacteria bacterium]
MAKLTRFEESKFPKFANAKLQSVKAVQLYYLHHGRNAWHSTWVQQYSDGCLHCDLSSAKGLAERSRTQGSVFYIRQTPALLFKCQVGDLLVTQINTTQPLSGYSPNALTRLAPTSTAINGAMDCYIAEGAPIIGVAKSFHPSSRFWITPPPLNNSILIVATSDAGAQYDDVNKNRKKNMQSFSNGRNVPLGWSQIPQEDTVTSKFATAIAEFFS